MYHFFLSIYFEALTTIIIFVQDRETTTTNHLLLHNKIHIRAINTTKLKVFSSSFFVAYVERKYDLEILLYFLLIYLFIREGKNKKE